MHSDDKNLQMTVGLLKGHPFFNVIPEDDLKELVKHSRYINYPINKNIVKAGDIVDSILLIESGNALVTTPDNEVLSTLSTGEIIGLSQDGFYSKTGVRSATVTATKMTRVLRIDLTLLNTFIDRYFQNDEIKKYSNILSKQALVKQIEPFRKVDVKTISAVLDKIEVIELSPDSIIFHENDVADCCYYLTEGKVRVYLENADNTHKTLAKLKKGSLFGELGLILSNKRTATVSTLTHCQLLVLKRQEFDLLVRRSSNSAEVLTSMMMDRFRPIQSAGITVTSRLNAEKEKIYILKDSVNGDYCQLTDEALFIWNLLDGTRTIKDLSYVFYKKYEVVGTEDISQLILDLMEAGFIQNALSENYVEKPHLAFWEKIIVLLSKLLQLEYSFKNVDGKLNQLYLNAGYIFYTSFAKITMIIVALVGVVLFINATKYFGNVIENQSHAWTFLVIAGFLNCIAMFLHEMAHALTTKAYGFQVHRFGIGWFWLGPMAFTDTTDMWLTSRGPRTAVNFAGIWINIVFSGLLSIIAYSLPYPAIATVLWLLALYSYLLAFYNLDPLFELDGYYLLMDLLDKSDLRLHATRWLLYDFKKTFFDKHLMKKYFAEITYWLGVILFNLVAAIMAYLLQKYIFYHFLPKNIGPVKTSYLKEVLFVLVIVISFGSIYSKLKNARKPNKNQATVEDKSNY